LHRTLVIHAPKRETSGVMSLFHDRVDAGRPLADLLYAAGLGGDEVVVLGLPRGGVPVAAEVARLLGAPLDVIIVRKLGVPSEPELAMGALGEDGVQVENEGVMGSATLSGSDIGAIVRREEAELVRRARRYRKGRPRLNLQGRRAIIVDDGIATGSTARAACRVARAHGAARVVLAVPVAPKATVLALQDECDDIFSVATPESFSAVGEWYDDFSPTSDAEVVELLRNAQS
jgi:putative phosphoribosyl transferase